MKHFCTNISPEANEEYFLRYSEKENMSQGFYRH